MAETPTRTGPTSVGTSATAVYTAGGASTWAIVRDIQVTNATAAAVTFSLGIDTATTDATAEHFEHNHTLQAGESWGWGGFLALLGGSPADRLYAICDTAAGINVTVSAVTGP